MYEEYDRLLSFCSVRHAIRAEELFIAAGIRVVSLPKPREIDITCGQCILFMAVEQEKVMALIKSKNVYWAALFKRDGVNKSYDQLLEFEDRML